MVATAHYLGSDAALDALKQGGTAVDAAIAAASTLGVVLPHMIGLGGDAFWLIYDAHSNRVYALNGSGPAGQNVTLARYAGDASIPHRGPRSAITVPGAVDSWRLAHERFGHLPIARLLERSIAYARDGIPTSTDLSGWIATDHDALAADPGSSGIFLHDGSAPLPGSRLCQGSLAKTLSQLSANGLRDFYTQAGRTITSYLAVQGGYLTAEDFAGYQARWVEPICSQYRDYDACQVPPPSQGMAGLLMLNFLNGIALSDLGPDSSKFYHALIQAVKWAFQKRDHYLCDPAFGEIPLRRLLDPSLAASERDDWLNDPLRMLQGRASSRDTTFICTADAHGNAVGLVQSLAFDFGSCVTDPATGVLMQNRGSYFSLDRNHPNALHPGKQPASTLMSAMLLKDGAPYLVYGSQGGDAQPQAQTALVSRIVDFGMDVQGALDSPRILCGRSWGDDGTQLLLESRACPEAFDGLRRRGHPVRKVEWPYPRMGTAQAIRLKGPWSEFFEAGADVRGEGIALGF